MSRRILAWDRLRSHTDTLALPFCHLTIEDQKPPPAGYPTSLVTIGDHIRKRRMDLGLQQRQVASDIGVSTDTVCLWETQGRTPETRAMPRIVSFLGYMPMVKPRRRCDELLAFRLIRGYTQQEAARAVGVDPSTWRAWENAQALPGSLRTKSAFGKILPVIDSQTWSPISNY